MNPTNIEVTVYHYGRTCVQWHYNGWRYHFWMRHGGAFEADNNALYKNPIEPSLDSRTLTLRANAITNAAVIDKVRAVVEEQDLLGKAVAAFEVERETEKAEYQRSIAYSIERELAEAYFSVLEQIVRERAPGHEALDSITSMRIALRRKAGLPC